ncbi:hypothetical protein [Cupriavidus taiwanensis]|uniref:Uncharacterized protein n=1 Tax=Cupriavidus taiwanensis TaxID=164546 RepID=A0A375JAI8_9BURK|nr:hypothetical protein [Cupriavidus taiwanensis]SPS02205.1 hypothetical protein CBM2634_P180009 [Cupriavidus taiwanensis]
MGLLAELTEAIGYIQRDDDFKLIGRAAERWQRTIVGDWSIGRRRGEWQRQPPLDETLRERLRQLLDAPALSARRRSNSKYGRNHLMAISLFCKCANG